MDAGLLIVRLVVGLTMAAHGAQKLFGWFGGYGLTGTGNFMEQIGFRPGRAQALAAGVGELGAGLFLAAGFLTPGAAAVLVAVMLVAGLGVHRKGGFFAQQGGYEYTLVLGAVALALAFTGPGAVSVDRALGFDWSGATWGLAALVAGALGGTVPLVTRGPARA
jgi:putative oxidoreductase